MNKFKLLIWAQYKQNHLLKHILYSIIISIYLILLIQNASPQSILLLKGLSHHQVASYWFMILAGIGILPTLSIFNIDSGLSASMKASKISDIYLTLANITISCLSLIPTFIISLIFHLPLLSTQAIIEALINIIILFLFISIFQFILSLKKRETLIMMLYFIIPTIIIRLPMWMSLLLICLLILINYILFNHFQIRQNDIPRKTPIIYEDLRFEIEYFLTQIMYHISDFFYQLTDNPSVEVLIIRDIRYLIDQQLNILILLIIMFFIDHSLIKVVYLLLTILLLSYLRTLLKMNQFIFNQKQIKLSKCILLCEMYFMSVLPLIITFDYISFFISCFTITVSFLLM